jgi:hypothetical protein
MKGTQKTRSLTTAPPPPADPKPYEPTAHERAAAQRLLDRRANKPPAPKYKVTIANGRTNITADHREPVVAFSLLTNAFSTSDAHFAEGLLYQLADASRTGKDLTARELNTMIATVHAIGPRDPTETLLATQMAAVHQATMVAARRLNHTETIAQQDSCSGMLNKLARTFASQVEALKRYRADGEQKVTVQHQHVNVSANQAVVGVNQGGGGAHEKSSQSHVLGKSEAASPPNASGTALLSHEQAVPMPMPGAGSEGQEGVPVPRCESGRAEGEGKRCMAARDGDQ